MPNIKQAIKANNQHRYLTHDMKYLCIYKKLLIATFTFGFPQGQQNSKSLTLVSSNGHHKRNIRS